MPPVRAPDQTQSGQGTASSASPRMFDNWVLDKLSRTHHLTPIVVYLPVVTAMFWLGGSRLSWPLLPAGALAGYILWTLVEYFGHRFLFHWQMRGRFGARFHFMIHGVHHDHPSDPLRLVMSLLMSAPIMVMAALALRLICGPDLVLPVLAGFIAGYVGYDALHYHFHHREPRSAVGRAFKRWHMLHHFRDATTRFGVSAPWWDAVFGTMPIKSS